MIFKQFLIVLFANNFIFIDVYENFKYNGGLKFSNVIICLIMDKITFMINNYGYCGDRGCMGTSGGPCRDIVKTLEMHIRQINDFQPITICVSSIWI